MTPLEKDAKKEIKALLKKIKQVEEKFSKEDIEDALNQLGVKPFGDPPGTCQPGFTWSALLSRCVPKNDPV